ncbi:MAG TPA: ABC transporter substrate-binding protein [Burkholderiales bacterium]
MNRRDTLIALVAFGAAPLRSFAQQPGKIPRVGVLGVTSAVGYALQIEAMRQGFRDLGYVEGQNIVIEYRWAEGRRDRLPALAAELIRLQPDILVTSGAGTRVLKEATTTVPIVMAAGGDAVANGLIASLAQPGGNITGSTFFGPELLAKRLEMLKEAVPRLARVAVLVNPDSRDNRVNLEVLKKTATALNIELLEVPARSPNEFDDVFALILRRRAGGLIVFDDSMFVANMRRLGELSAAKHLPGAGSGDYAEGGGLLVYGVNFPELWRRAPLFVDKILKGGKPDTIPVERATQFALVVNLKTAKTLRLTIPQSLLVRADEVIR